VPHSEVFSQFDDGVLFHVKQWTENLIPGGAVQAGLPAATSNREGWLLDKIKKGGENSALLLFERNFLLSPAQGQ
jgi:hypothetical protein